MNQDNVTDISQDLELKTLVNKTNEAMKTITPVHVKGVMGRLPDMWYDSIAVVMRGQHGPGDMERLGNYLAMAMYQTVQDDEKRADVDPVELSDVGFTDALRTKPEKKEIMPYHKWLLTQEAKYFKELMDEVDGNQSKVTELCGLNRGTVRKKLKLCRLIHE